jgi:hypothetical protein
MTHFLPQLFDHIPPRLFVPLASKLHRLYWEILLIVYRLHNEAGVDEIGKDSLLNAVEEHLRDRELTADDLSELAEDAESDASEPADVTERRLWAWRLLRRLQLAGWFDYEYRRDSGHVLRFADHSARIVDLLEQIATGQRPEVRGLAYNIKQILTDKTKRKTDPGFVLYQARDQTRAFLKELKILSANIGRYVERATQQDEVHELLALQWDEYQQRVVEPSYQRFKTSDNVLRFRTDILDELDELINDPWFAQEAAKEVERREPPLPDDSPAVVRDWLERMRHDFRSLDRLIEEIDDRHARYARATLNRIRYRLFGDQSAEGRLVEILHALGRLQPWHAESWDDLGELYLVRICDESSLYTEPRRGTPVVAEPVKESSASEERRRMLVQRARDELSQRISREKTFEFACRLLGGRQRVDLREAPLGNDSELLQLIYLHAYRKDVKAPYEIILSDDGMELVWKGDYGFRPASLEHRNGSQRSRPK